MSVKQARAAEDCVEELPQRSTSAKVIDDFWHEIKPKVKMISPGNRPPPQQVSRAMREYLWRKYGNPLYPVDDRRHLIHSAQRAEDDPRVAKHAPRW